MNRLARIGIRPRIVGGSLLIAILISIAAGIVIDAQIARIVRDGTEAVLQSDSAPYVAALSSAADGDLDAPGAGRYVAVIDAAGRVLLDSMPAELSSRLDDTIAESGAERVATGGGDYLMLATDVPRSGGEWHVVAARPAASEDQVVGQMRALLWGGLGVIDLSVGLAALLLTSASLRPVTSLRRSADRLTDDPSGDLLPVSPADDEIARLARTLNALVGRLRDAAARERQLVADASHELRTPAALLRTRLELAQRDEASADDLRADLAEAEKSAVRLGELITSMLTLSSLEADASVVATPVSEALEEVEAAVDRGRFRARDTAVDIRYEAVGEREPGWVAARPDDIGRVVDNLIGNALAVLEGAGRLEIRAVVDDASDTLRLSVGDTGGGMDETFVARAFERFSRDDPSRSRAEGAGLGLPIVGAIALRAGGHARIDNVPGVGLTVVVEVPISRLPSVQTGGAQ